MLGSYEKPVTGMTVAEKWYEVGRRVENGGAFSGAVWDVFNQSQNEVAGEGWNLFENDPTDSNYEYTLVYAMLSDFLALEAEDEEQDPREDCPWKCSSGDAGCLCSPPTADVVAEEEPIEGPKMWEAPFRQVTITVDSPERRKSWNAKLADGLRKWAHWLEERF